MFQWVRKLFSRSSRRNRNHGAVRAKYDAAQTTVENSSHWLNADSLSANAANSAAVRAKLRDRGRYETANNSYAAGLVEGMANDVVGSGPRLQLSVPGIDPAIVRAIEQAHARWAKQIDLAEKLRIMHAARFPVGESFGLIFPNPAYESNGIQLDLRVYEADQIATPDLDVFDRQAVDGMRFDDFGNVSEYHLMRNHPGAQFWSATWDYERIPAARVLHWFRPTRAGQARGIPEITPGLPLFAQLRRYTLAVIGAAELAAMLAGVLETNTTPANGAPVEIETMDTIPIAMRSLLTLPQGWKANQFKPEQPVSTYGDFKGQILNEIGRGVQAPFNIISGNSSGYNYSSGRLDHLLYYRAIRVERSRMRLRLLDPLFSAWCYEARGIGLIHPSIPHLSEWKWEWFWDGFDSIDPQKDAATDETELRNNTTTLAEIWARKGKDWEEMLKQRARENALMKELGISASPAIPTGPMPIDEGVPEDA